MQKKLGAILLIAGTCIGSGMIALPMSLAKLGIIPSLFLMLFIWILMYFTSLISIELNLLSGKGNSLDRLGRIFSGKIAENIGIVSIKLLSYSLLAVFIYGGSSIMQKLLNLDINIIMMQSAWGLLAFILLLLPIKLIDYINRVLFISLIVVVITLIIGLTTKLNLNNLPLYNNNYKNISYWIGVIPVVFTSFGFHVIFHTLTDYCNKEAKLLKASFLWGSLIPTIVYIIWTSSVLAIIYDNNYEFYHEMITGRIEVGDLINELSKVSNWSSVQTLTWWVSLLAILTSVLGVSIGLFDAINSKLNTKSENRISNKILSSVATILPAYILVVLIPNAFIKILGFAGIILAIIAILLPSYLLLKVLGKKRFHYDILSKKNIIISVLLGIIIILCEVINIFVNG